MEILYKPTQKLSLSNTYNKLHQTLWQQKQKNAYLQKQNTILKSKISFINQNQHHKPYPEECQFKKSELKKIYQAIKNQQQWINKTQTMIEQKNYQKIVKKKYNIQKNIIKYNKKAKILQKKHIILQNKLQKQQQFNLNHNHNHNQFNGYNNNEYNWSSHNEQNDSNNYSNGPNVNHNHNNNESNSNCLNTPHQITKQAVLQQLQNQNKQLYDLLQYKQTKLQSENQQVNKINKQILQLLQLKNFLKKYHIDNNKNNICKQININNSNNSNNNNSNNNTNNKYNINKNNNSNINSNNNSNINNNSNSNSYRILRNKSKLMQYKHSNQQTIQNNLINQPNPVNEVKHSYKINNMPIRPFISSQPSGITFKDSNRPKLTLN